MKLSFKVFYSPAKFDRRSFRFSFKNIITKPQDMITFRRYFILGLFQFRF